MDGQNPGPGGGGGGSGSKESNLNGEPQQFEMEPQEATQEDPYAKPDGPVLKITIEEKESFASKIAYLMILIGNAVGFGNIWRFPYLIQQNGGVIFLIPYCIMLATLGIPMFFLELAIGQRLHKSALKSWNDISHYLGGVGFACGMICLIIGFYYTTLIAWCIRYTFSVFGERLPWFDCKEAELSCRDPHNITAAGQPQYYNDRDTIHCEECNRVGASTHFWYNNVLDVTDGVDTRGNFNGGVATCLFAAWFIVWAILVKGLRSTGKVVYFTAMFPYCVLITFFIVALTLEDMTYGYKIAFTPDWNKLADVQVWFTAGTQIFFSLGLGFGLLVSFSALNPAKNNCYKDAIMVSLINCSTSLFASMVIFPILGFKGSNEYKTCYKEAQKTPARYIGVDNMTDIGDCNATSFHETDDKMKFIGNCMSKKTGDWSDMVLCDREVFITKSASGTGLVFIVFTQALLEFPASQLFAFLFFLMLLSLGIGSGFTTIEGVVTTLHELNLFGLRIKKWKITSVVCLIMFICSFVFAFGWGNYVLTFLDEFTANWTLLIVAFFECIGVAWIYGLKQFSYDIQLMTGKPPNLYLLICWRIVSPIAMLGLLVCSFAQYGSENALQYTVWNHKKGLTEQKPWPTYCVIIGFLLTLLVIGSIPVFAVLAKFKIYILKPEAPAHFPEDELRAERNITDADDLAPENALDKVLFWGSSHELYRRRSSTVSAIAFNMGLTGPHAQGSPHHGEGEPKQAPDASPPPASPADPNAAIP